MVDALEAATSAAITKEEHREKGPTGKLVGPFSFIAFSPFLLLLYFYIISVSLNKTKELKMESYYTSIQQYKENNPEHKYFANRMQDHPNTEWMVCYGNPSDANGKLASEKWNIVSMMMNYKDAQELTDQLNTYPHNLTIGDRVVYKSDKTPRNFFNGKTAVVVCIGQGSVTIKFDEDMPLLPANKELVLLPYYIIPLNKE